MTRIPARIFAGESFGNRRVCDKVLITLARLTPPGWVPVTGLAVTLTGDPEPTVRRPDVMVLSETAPRGLSRQDPGDVALVVEVVSPTSRERDLVWKVREYAAAGIPAYLVVDPDSDALTLHTLPGALGYARQRSGSSVTWLIDGQSLTLSLAEFLD